MNTSVKQPDLPSDWLSVIGGEFQKEYFRQLKSFLLSEKQAGYALYPPANQILRCLQTTPFDSVKVVILGQDPYHGTGQAHGLCFSVPKGQDIPPSLRNIFKELSADIHIPIPTHGDLSAWAKQGVLLLNATLTVRAGMAGSHQNKGWEIFTDAIIHTLSKRRKNLVFLLWGAYAGAKASLIEGEHLILKAPHPSPLSAHRGFLSCRHFSKTNDWLREKGLGEIKWELSGE